MSGRGGRLSPEAPPGTGSGGENLGQRGPKTQTPPEGPQRQYMISTGKGATQDHYPMLRT